MSTRTRVRTYTGSYLDRLAYPMGGIGAGMICLDGTGGFSHVSLRHKPDVFHEPWIFAALCVKGKPNVARVLEGPVPKWKVVFPWGKSFGGSGNGNGDKGYGLPRFRKASFGARFPFGTVTLADAKVPLRVSITGWSPFVPLDADSSSLPMAGVEYCFANPTKRSVEAVFSFHARNFIHAPEGDSGVRCEDKGLLYWQAPTAEKPWVEGYCSISVDGGNVGRDNQWFRGGWFDARTMMWKDIESGKVVDKPTADDGKGREGGSVYVGLKLKPGEQKTLRLRLCWYVPDSDVRAGFAKDENEVTLDRIRYRPWYAKRFAGIDQVSAFWREQYDSLRARTAAFTDCLYDTTLPSEAIDAIAANLTILKSPTSLRQQDGRFWGWEGCCDGWGCCHGTCTHVWNYAQAMPHLFPDLERSLRYTEFTENQDERGHQNMRAKLPIVENDHGFHAASDGQLGGIIKTYREWRVSGDTGWLRSLWPKVKKSLDFCITTWDPRHTGGLEEPHHNTYDIEFWGPDGMCGSFYLGALHAGVLMAEAMGEDVPLWRELRDKGRKVLEKDLWNGEYFFQKVMWKGLDAADPVETSKKGLQLNYSEEAIALLQQEGPKYQYGTGCLADGVLGAWVAACSGLGDILDRKKLQRHVDAVFAHNFRADLSAHANPQRPSYALGDEAGLLVCTWPQGGALSLPFPYSNEVWTGIEYQVASHLAMLGRVKQAMAVVKAARDRYDGTTRNPFNEFECGHWYARAMSSYGLLQGLTGIRYDAVEKVLYVNPSVSGDFRAFLCTAGGYGTAGVSKGKPFFEVKSGAVEVKEIKYAPCKSK